MLLRVSCLFVALTVGALPSVSQAKCSVGVLAELAVTMQGRQPLVDATINGSKVHFIADSGAFYSTISQAVASELKLPRRPAPVGFSITGVGGSADAGVTSVKDFGFADKQLHNVEFVVGGSDTGRAGLLGQNVLGLADAEYDLPHGVIRLMKTEGCEKLGMAYWADKRPYTMIAIQPIKQANYHIVGDAVVNGTKLHVLFDTGASSSVISRDAAKRVGITPDSPGVEDAGEAHGLGSRLIQNWVVPIESIDIGGEIIRNARLSMHELSDDIDMIAGIDFFLSHRVFVANSQHRMYFTYEGGPVFGIDPKRAVTPDGNTIAITDSGAEPTDAAGYSQRGTAFASKRDFTKALADLDKAVGLAPEVARYWQIRAQIRLSNGQVPEAMTDYDKAVALAPSDADLRITRGQLARRLGDRAKALDDARAADSALAPGAQTRLALAGLFEGLGDPERALASYDLWLRNHAQDALRPTAFNGRCFARAQLNRDLDAALSDCNAALKLRPDTAAYLDSRGLVQLRRGDLAKAIADYSAALAIEPKLAWTRYQRGIAEQRAGNADAAHADLAAAIQADPNIAARAKAMGLIAS